MSSAAIVILLSHAATASVTIHVDPARREDTPVSRQFFGQFGEHLGCNVYNGQYAQILRNPGFEGYEYFEEEVQRAQAWFGLPGVANGRDAGLACYWLPEGDASFALDPDAFNSKSCQKAEVVSEGGLRTPVYLPLHRVREYAFSFYARAGRAAKARIRLVTAGGDVVAQATTDVPGPSWTRRAVTLNVADGPRSGDLCYLVLLFEGPCTFWIDHAELFPADHLGGLDPDVVRLCRDLRPSLLRFPGGNFASGYHWRDGIGPRHERVTTKNLAWGGIETNQFGTGEWLAFARAIGAEPMICVNCGNGAPEEAADWVRYCNDPPDTELGRLRASDGHRAPYRVRYWEVGNELWGDWQIGHCTPEEYAGRYDAFAKAMTDADPSILLIANGGDGDWNERFLKRVTQPVRSLSVHRLVGWDVPPECDDAEVAMALAAYGLAFDAELDAMQRVLLDNGFAGTRLAITELMSVAPRPHGPRTHCRHAEGLFFAGMMNACVRRRGLVELITRTAILNHGGGRAKIREVAFPEPVHFVSRIYGTMSGRWPVECKVDAPAYATRLRGMPALEDVPVIECVALLDDAGEKLTLLVTNRDPRQDHTAAIVLANFEPKAAGRTRTVAGPPGEMNVWNEPSRVRLVDGATETGPTFRYTFPACSLTEIVLSRAR